jgi:nucleotide-binding universal stress UspA family protein
MKPVILLTDFSETARNAALYALKMLEPQNVHFQLLHAFDIEFSGSPYIMQVKEEMAEESMKSLKKELSRLHVNYPNTHIELASRFGPLIEVLRNEISDLEPSLIVLGCKGASAIENFLLGSNAFDIIKNVNHPMLVVPNYSRFKTPKKIVFATDLKNVDISKMAEPINELVKTYKSELLFLNILQDQTLDRISAEEKIAACFPDIKLSFHFLESSDIPKSILQFMEENDATLVTLIRHHYNFFERLFQPSITKQMIKQPHHPMLILHQAEE